MLKLVLLAQGVQKMQRLMLFFVQLNVCLSYKWYHKFSDILFYNDRGAQITKQYEENEDRPSTIFLWSIK